MPTAHESLDEIYWRIRQLESEEEKLAYLAELAAQSPERASALQGLVSQESNAEKLFGQLSQGAQTAIPHGMLRDGAAVAEFSEGEIGDKSFVGPYRLLEPIGEGGMGIVYLAQQTEPVRRKVALKVIKPGMDSRQVIARFEAERQALAMMEHPNIAKVLDAGTTESGLPYFVMELVRGISITDYCDRARMTLSQRLALICDACAAIQHAHNKGIIHRDIKPSNVLITEHDGTPTLKVIDFGVAKALTDNLTDKTLFTGVFQTIGTPLYMSPEQGSLSNSDVDVRSDVYSLGVMLYELISGKLPIDQETARELSFDQLREKISETEPPRPSRRVSTLKEDRETIANNRRVDVKNLARLITSELDWIVMTAIAKDRLQRYQSARELGEDIERFLAGEAVQACPPSVPYLLRKQFRRHRVAISFLFVIALATLAAIIGTTSQMIRATRAERESSSRLTALTAEQSKTQQALDAAQSAEATQRILREKAETSERESKWSLYVAQLYPMRHALAHREYGRLQSLLDATVPQEGEPDFRGWEWYYLQDQVHSATKRITMEGIRGLGLTWSEKRRLLAIPMLEKGIIAILDGDTFELKSKIGIDRHVHELAFSPSGNQLAIGTAWKDVVVVDIDSPHQQTVYTPFEDTDPNSETIGGLIHVGWSSDEKYLGASLRVGDVVVINTDDGSTEVFERPEQNVSLDLHWHPNKPWVTVGHRWGERRIYDVENGTDWSLPQESVAYGIAVRWSPTGKWLATSEESQLRIADSKSRTHAILDGHASPINHIRWVDDSTVVTAAKDHTIRFWDVDSKSLINVVRIHDVGVGSLEIDVDHHRVFSGDQYENVVVSNISPHEPYQANRMNTTNASRLIPSSNDFYSGKNSITVLEWSPDGTRLAAVSEVGNLFRWSGDCAVFHPDTARQVSSWETGLCKGLSWSLDGLGVYRMATYSTFKVEDPFLGMTLESTKKSFVGEPIAYWSPDRSLVVRNSRDKPLVLNARTFALESRFDSDRNRFAVSSGLFDGAWSRDGRKFVGVGYGFGHLMTDNGEVIKLESGVDGADNSFASAWHPSGRLIAIGNRLGKINLFESEKGQRLTNLGTHTGIVTGLDFSPDGRRLASCGSDGTVGIWDTATGNELLVLTVPGVPRLSHIRWSPDGLQLAAGTGNHGIVVWGRSTQEPVPRTATFLQTGKVLKTLGDPEIQSRWINHVEPLTWRNWYQQMVRAVGQPDEPFQASKLGDSLLSIANASIEVDQWKPFMIAGQSYVDAINDPAQAIRVADGLNDLIDQKSGSRSDRLREKIRLTISKVNRFVSLSRFSQADKAVDQNIQLAEQLVKLTDATKHDWRLWRTAHVQKVNVIARAYESTLSDSDVKEQGANAQPSSQAWADRLELALSELGKTIVRFPDLARWIENDGSEDVASWSGRLLDRTVQKEIAITSRSELLHLWAPRWNSTQYRDRYFQAICHASSGNVDAFRAVCRSMIKEYWQSKDFYELSDTAWTCALLPGALNDYEVAIKIAKEAEQMKPDNLAIKDTLAALYVRVGQFDEAIEIYESILDEERDEFSNDTIWAFLAIAEIGRGNTEAAQRWLKRAERYNEQLRQQESEAKLSITWYRRLLLHLLNDEARSRVQAAEE